MGRFFIYIKKQLAVTGMYVKMSELFYYKK